MVSTKHSEDKYRFLYCIGTWGYVPNYNVKHVSSMRHCQHERGGLERMPHLCQQHIALGFEHSSHISSHTTVIFWIPIHFCSRDFLIWETGLEQFSVCIFFSLCGYFLRQLWVRAIRKWAVNQSDGRQASCLFQDSGIFYHSRARSRVSNLSPQENSGICKEIEVSSHPQGTNIWGYSLLQAFSSCPIGWWHQ